MDALGLSMALGTFIAGILLAESEYRHELEVAIDPFKALLLGLFFISVGMALNIGVLFTHVVEVLIAVVTLVAIKALVLYILARVYGMRSSERLQFSGVLSQGGEFAFVLFSAASSAGLFHQEQLSLLLVIVTLSMITTPLLMKLIDLILVRRFNNQDDENTEKHYVEDDEPQVILVGFGRFGQVVGRLLMANNMRVTVLEKDISVVSLTRSYGYKVYYGDSNDLELLRAAGAERAQSIIVTCDDPSDTMATVALCQQHFPHLNILARARGRVEAHELLQAGITDITRETFLSAVQLAGKALVSLGIHPYQAERAQQYFTHLDEQMLKDLMPHHDETGHISRVKEARRELEDVFRREMQQDKQTLGRWDAAD